MEQDGGDNEICACIGSLRGKGHDQCWRAWSTGVLCGAWYGARCIVLHGAWCGVVCGVVCGVHGVV